MNICYRAQKAFANFLQNAELTLVDQGNIYTGIQNAFAEEADTEEATIDLPCVIVDCQSAEISTLQTGLYTAVVQIIVKTSADDQTDTQHDDLCEEVFGAIFTDTAAADVSSLVDYFTAFQIREQGQQCEVEGRAFKTTFTMQVECSPSQVS